MSIIRVVKKFSMVLSRHQLLRIFELGVLMLIGGILETLSVSLILPFMDIVINPEATMRKDYARFFCELFGIKEARIFLVVIAIALAVLYIFKNVYLLLEYNIQYRFVYGNMFMMQQRLLDAFINKPYEYFLNVNSGEVIRIINGDTNTVFALLVTLLSFFTEMIVSVMLVIAVFVMTPFVTVIMAIVLLSMVVFINRILKPIFFKMGKDVQDSAAGMNKWLLQSIQGIKELKVTKKEIFFEKKYDKYGWRYVNSIRRNAVLSNVPRFFIEAICMSMVFIIIAIYIFSGAEIKRMIPILSAIAVAAIRLLPSVNRISQALAGISYGEPMLDKLIECLQDISGKKEVSLSMKFENDISGSSGKKVEPLQDVLGFNNISYKYPTGDTTVLKGASFSIKRGQAVGIVGPSGAGKTTAVDILLGLLVPQKGQILVDGVDIIEDMIGWLSQIGYIPQQIFMLDDTIRANVAFGEEDISDEEVWHALSEAALDEFVRSLPEGLDTEIGERGIRLSGGQRQRIGIARALYHDPDVLFFDEATSALDNETESAIMESINRLQGKKTLVIIAHRLTTIEKCDVIYRIENGTISQEKVAS